MCRAAISPADGLYPKSADVKDVARRYTPGELFWLLKNGIKMSGMPFWSDHGDNELWVTAVFLEKLSLSNQARLRLVMECMTHGGARNHGGMGGMPGMPSMHGADCV